MVDEDFNLLGAAAAVYLPHIMIGIHFFLMEENPPVLN